MRFNLRIPRYEEVQIDVPDECPECGSILAAGVGLWGHGNATVPMQPSSDGTWEEIGEAEIEDGISDVICANCGHDFSEAKL